ncbi:dihydroxyacetone kinase subunit L [Pelagibius litoralis]|uniref:Dihydroxyacetone kinase subunit L n=1 Tax=Pelagibius litoralis TaxID=374515 RepID=A0A967EXJ1_9PROT|nr:dihydroxyacetone kinase subunit DhaL [Pelagibius litoralis]NIA69248.1 dihydroxyacetone kinase subunit L [Pelagibius litoralis]
MLDDAASRRDLIKAVAQEVIDHAEELTALDQAIGDGDHGVNMKRGAEAVLADIDNLAEKTLPEGLKAIGMALVMKVGGASGPLYGTFFMTLGKSLPEEPAPADTVAAFEAAFQAVMARGKSHPGQKTMLDVLAPALECLQADPSASAALCTKVAEAAEATIPMLAEKGRASFLGERSIGHMDPGARSSALIITTVCKTLGAAGK